MRKPERLDEFYDLLKELHKKYLCDWREFQLLYNMFSSLSEDPFYWEHEKAMDFIRDYFEKNSAYKKENEEV